MNVYAKQKQTHRQNNPVVMKEEREERDILGIWD